MTVVVQAWLERHGPFDAVLDGANIALFGQNFDAGGFAFAQVEATLSTLRSAGLGKRPLLVRSGLTCCHELTNACGRECWMPASADHVCLENRDECCKVDANVACCTGGSGPVILTCPGFALGLSMGPMAAAQVLHESRVNAPWAKQPPARRLLQRLAAEHSFYCAPHGSNDDWYWMYAAVRAGAHGRFASQHFDTPEGSWPSHIPALCARLRWHGFSLHAGGALQVRQAPLHSLLINPTR